MNLVLPTLTAILFVLNHLDNFFNWQFTFKAVQGHSYKVSSVNFMHPYALQWLIPETRKTYTFIATQWARTLLQYNNYLSHHSLSASVQNSCGLFLLSGCFLTCLILTVPLRAWGGLASLARCGTAVYPLFLYILFPYGPEPVITPIVHRVHYAFGKRGLPLKTLL